MRFSNDSSYLFNTMSETDFDFIFTTDSPPYGFREHLCRLKKTKKSDAVTYRSLYGSILDTDSNRTYILKFLEDRSEISQGRDVQGSVLGSIAEAAVNIDYDELQLKKEIEELSPFLFSFSVNTQSHDFDSLLFDDLTRNQFLMSKTIFTSYAISRLPLAKVVEIMRVLFSMDKNSVSARIFVDCVDAVLSDSDETLIEWVTRLV